MTRAAHVDALDALERAAVGAEVLPRDRDVVAALRAPVALRAAAKRRDDRRSVSESGEGKSNGFRLDGALLMT